VPVFDLVDVPVICNQLHDDPASAQSARKGNLTLLFCDHCGLIFNDAFDSNAIDYDSGYDNALHFSPLFEQFARRLAQRLIETYDLRGEKIFEIGCGDGYFLDLMVRSGAGSGKGFDPSAPPRSANEAAAARVEIVSEHFRPGAKQIDEPYGALLCRHVLEHIPEPVPFLQEIRDAIGDRNCLVYFEVPNASWMLRSRSLWDVIYEHVTYWTAPSLEALLRRAGFTPVSIRTDYNDQYLMIEAYPAMPEPSWTAPEQAIDAVREEVSQFSSYADGMINEWRERLRDLKAKDKRAVIWGAGSKGVTFANIFGSESAAIAGLVDVNSRKIGRFVPGAALPVVEPSQLPDMRPDLIIVANPIYTDEIRQTVGSLGLAPELEAISH